MTHLYEEIGTGMVVIGMMLVFIGLFVPGALYMGILSALVGVPAILYEPKTYDLISNGEKDSETKVNKT
jgi:hypothetical protein